MFLLNTGKQWNFIANKVCNTKLRGNSFLTPVYISVDKDVLNPQSAVTNWDQGSLTLNELEHLLSIILKHEKIIGIDICGECSSTLNIFEAEKGTQLDNTANQELLNLFLNCQTRNL